jgi:GMP synthase (glutamine-hydrolysing)
MKIHVVMHEEFEAPGAIVVWANKNKCPVSYPRLFAGEGFPTSPDSFDYLCVMGGPQSPATTILECPYFDATKEIQFIKQAIKENKYLLGVCLGAQLISEALGAKFDHSPNREIGVFDVKLTEKAKNDPIFSQFSDSFAVGHWHGDMPGLTSTSEVLATSEGCPRQVVKYSPRIYGFQCHFEFTKETIQGMIKNCADELEKYKGLPYVQTAKSLVNYDYSVINEKLYVFLDDMKQQFARSK